MLARRAASLALAAALAVTPLGSSAAHAEPLDRSSRARIVGLLSDSIRALSMQSSASDPRYFSGGVWLSGQDDCFRCNVGPGVAAAAVAATTGDKLALDLAIQTFDHAIAAHGRADGSFGPPAAGETGPDIQTMMFANELGTALIALTPQLDPDRIHVWTSALTGAADFLIRNNNLSYYTNGNIVLGNAITMALAYRVTTNGAYQGAYQQALAFAINPDLQRWGGHGLIYTATPTRSDGSDGAAYLTESGGLGPGYDAEYTALQADMATRLFWVNGDQRVSRLMNLFMNQLRPRIDTTAWTIDTSGGTRHPQANRVVGFYSPVLAVLALQGGRADLAPLVSSQVASMDQGFRGALTYSSPGMYFSLGSEPASLLLAAGASPPRPGGYWMLSAVGAVYAFGAAPALGNAPVGGTPAVHLEPTPSGGGYWVVDALGHVFAFGDAAYLGGAASIAAGEHVVSMSGTPTGNGYWLFTNRGRVMALGDALPYGDMAGKVLNGPVLASVATPDGRGYYMVASDGGVFTFGHARFAGSMGATHLSAPVESLVANPNGSGYWLVASDGGIFSFAVPFYGSVGATRLNKPITGMVGSPTGSGYLLVGADGGIFAFGDVAFKGSLGSSPPPEPITGAATLR
jgi:hypothetical protein